MSGGAMNTDDRWRLAMHEAGHATALRLLGAHGRITATIGAAGGVTLAVLRDQGALALSIAAGPVAERAADQHAPPAITVPLDETPAVVSTPIGETQSEQLFRAVEHFPSDRQRLRDFACATTLAPVSVLGVMEELDDRASLLVAEHRDAIVTLARRLYTDGSIVLDPKDTQ